jgi:DNA-binding winged helix-turn-helix (wHTH) protein/predicted ATPase
MCARVLVSHRPDSKNLLIFADYKMRNDRGVNFGPFCLDFAAECLWKGPRAIKLRPKAFSVLDYLVSRPAQLVTKEELLNEVWAGTFVGEAVLKVAIRQIREALDDDPGAPRFIETAHRRGYRFIGEIKQGADTLLRDVETRRQSAGSNRGADANSQRVVGRDEALAWMQRCLDKVLAGERQTIFVTGEAGVGKTALVDAFLRRIPPNWNIRISRGQCLEQYGTSEAYLPVLEAIGRLAREYKAVANVLHSHAPMWLLQMPSLVSTSDGGLLRREVFGASHERMLREMGEALEVLAKELPLVLVLEDLHWSDYSTLDLISYLATQRQATRLMLIGTYRTSELIVSGHPLQAVKRELMAKKQCEELPLECLSEDGVAEYLSVRFSPNRFPVDLAGLIHERTEGNPLFMTNAVDYLVTEELIGKCEEGWELVVDIENIEVGVPDSIKQMIEKQLDHLGTNEQRILEAASVAGAEFSVDAVAIGLSGDRAIVEERCSELARRRQFIQDRGVDVLANGEAVSRYGFIHALYQNVLYERVSASRRVQLHRRIGEQSERIHGQGASEIAAELAMHFERGANNQKAVKYIQQAADNEIRRFAYQDAVALSRRGLELLAMLPDTTARAQQELGLHLTLGVPLIATEGYAAPDVGRVYRRARELCVRLGDTPEISQVLWGLWTFYTLRGELATARETAEEFLRLADRLPYPDLAIRGHWAMEITYLHLGQCSQAIDHFEKALRLYDPERHLDDAFLYALNPGVAMRCFAAWALWFLGYPDQASSRMQEALVLARELSEPHSLAHALFFAAMFHQLRREAQLAQEYADAAITVSTEHKLMLYQAVSTITLGWAQIEHGGQEEAIERIRRGLVAHQATGAAVLLPHFMGLLAGALCKAGQSAEGLRVLEEALAVAHRNGERFYEAELYRLKGELVLAASTDRAVLQAAFGGRAIVGANLSAIAVAESSFRQSLRIAQQWKARSFELRTALSLGRLYQKQGKLKETRILLEPIYNTFTEGFDTMDLREVKSLLETT